MEFILYTVNTQLSRRVPVEIPGDFPISPEKAPEPDSGAAVDNPSTILGDWLFRIETLLRWRVRTALARIPILH
jgi:hypothetical protein